LGDEDGGISWIKKEPLHGIYSDRMGSVDYSIPVNKWVGLKAIVRNINDGGNKVSVEGYVDDITTGALDGSNIEVLSKCYNGVAEHIKAQIAKSVYVLFDTLGLSI
jgi:hypothetical protein